MKSITFVKQVEINKLMREISFIPENGKVISVNASGTELVLILAADTTSEQEAAIATVVNNHDPITPDMHLIFKAKIAAAMREGNDIIAEFGARNIVKGLSRAQMEYLLDVLHRVFTLLQAGSLNLAKANLNEMTDATTDGLVPRAEIEYYMGRIDAAIKRL